MALPGVIDFATMNKFVKDSLALGPPVMLQPHWDSIINQGITSGYWTVIGAWTARGYTKAQIDQWDRLAEFQLEIGAWFALKRLSAMMPDSLSQANLDALDRRPEMVYPAKDGAISAVMTINGVAVDGEGDYSQANWGPMDTTGDMFVLPTSSSEDIRIGQLTRF
jgi:hypothetical protein